MAGSESEFPANADQAEFWNSAAGEEWVASQEALDARLGPLTDLLIERAAVAAGERVIDIGCGTGTTTLRLAGLVGPGGAVLGVDISAPMLAAAERRIARSGRTNVRLLRADAQTHPFEPEVHDLLFSRFGVMFFSDPVAAFRNLLAALRSAAGRLCFICWAPLDANPWFALPLAAAVRRLGPPEPRPPRAPGPLAFSDAAYVEEILTGAGFGKIAIERVDTVVPGARTAAEEAAFACEHGPAARLIGARAPDGATLGAIVAEIAAAFQPYETDAGVRMPASVFYVGARRR
ncbi:MAG TPA: methyltransferase domain-containing protein [Geminicoccaceae bacterium]|nr:methyltransferase domain-containing protein [Geminicoccaceae bacterium]